MFCSLKEFFWNVLRFCVDFNYATEVAAGNFYETRL